MDLNRIFGLLGRMLFRSAMRTGVDYVARGGKSEAEMTPTERKKAREMRRMAKRAQQATRLGRRLLK